MHRNNRRHDRHGLRRLSLVLVPFVQRLPNMALSNMARWNRPHAQRGV